MPTRWGSRVRGGWRSGSRRFLRCGIWRGGGATGLLGAERFSEAAEGRGERGVHAGGGTGAEFGDGEAGACGHRFDANCGERGGGFGGDGGEAAWGASEDPEADPTLATAVRGGGSERRGGDGGSGGSAETTGEEAGRDSEAAGAAEEIGDEEAVADG